MIALQHFGQGQYDRRLFCRAGIGRRQQLLWRGGYGHQWCVRHRKGMLFGSDFPDKGVRVTEEGGKLVIELHIKVIYGINISAVVKSITHKVRYVVEDATGLQVKRIKVSVDDIVS